MSHCHDSSDEESFVTQFGDDDDGEGRNESMDEAEVNKTLFLNERSVRILLDDLFWILRNYDHSFIKRQING